MLLWGMQEHVVALRGMGRALVAFDVAGLFEHLKTFYPALTIGTGAFVLAAVAVEFYRGTRVRLRSFGESVPIALGRLVWRNKRRYGGYIVHVGIVVVFFGIAGSAAYQQEAVRLLRPGQLMAVDSYLMRYEGYRLEAVDDHIGAVTTVSVFDRRTGDPLGVLEPEQRFHPNMLFADLRSAFLHAKRLGASGSGDYQDAVAGLYDVIQRLESLAQREVKTPSTEVAILASMSPRSPSRFGEDLYMIPLFVDPRTGEANFRVFINPMVNFIWLGGLILVLGAHLSVLPDARERKRLKEALELEERAVA
jgi:cytochrome c-type biogenesis protein CcmF